MILAETERLLIRPFQKSDLEPLAAMLADRDVMRFISKGETLSYTESTAYLERQIAHYEETGWSRFALIEKSSNNFIGFCGYAYFNGELDFGWRLKKEYWKKGYATEAAKKVLDLGHRTFIFPRIVSIAYSDNLASIKIMQKIGMKYEKDISLNSKPVVQYVSSLSE
ncbi:MAG: GNAT family N-acetyltransferase [Candidatus Kapaibacteriales bacterium]